MQYIQYYDSPLGWILISANETSLTGLWFIKQKYDTTTILGTYQEKSSTVLDQTKKWLDTYFSGKEPNFTPPLFMESTPFRKKVWDILLTIPYGQTMTYGDIAEQIVRERNLSRMSARAVGGAVGHNPISIIVPCHRVIGAKGKLTGYGGGLDKKIKLLALEKAEYVSYILHI